MGNGKEWKEGLGEWKSTPPLKLLSRVLFLWPLASDLWPQSWASALSPAQG